VGHDLSFAGEALIALNRLWWGTGWGAGHHGWGLPLLACFLDNRASWAQKWESREKREGGMGSEGTDTWMRQCLQWVII
jgi:hypothetical protein